MSTFNGNQRYRTRREQVLFLLKKKGPLDYEQLNGKSCSSKKILKIKNYFFLQGNFTKNIYFRFHFRKKVSKTHTNGSTISTTSFAKSKVVGEFTASERISLEKIW
jgi:hypothetical protein